MRPNMLAIDFGTSNSAAAIATGAKIQRIPIEPGSDTLPTAVFFSTGKKRMEIGTAATNALIDGQDGRYMRALKSVLGSSLLYEPRLIGGARRSLADVIAIFLAEVKLRAEKATGLVFSHVLSGRPVHFHARDLERDRAAENDLRSCYLSAGFENVTFLVEPEAAAMANHTLAQGIDVGLIVDIGGGTSDFSVFRSDGQRPQVLASYGIRLGGTDFDHAISMSYVMPHLGLGGQLRREMGAGKLSVPRGPYVDLATWAKIPFLYSGETRRLVRDMCRVALEPDKMARLQTVVDMELGHDIAQAVEAGKIAANSGQVGDISLGFVEPRLSVPVTQSGLREVLDVFREAFRSAVVETLRLSGLEPDAVDQVIFVGGSSLMSIVPEAMAEIFPEAQVKYTDPFTAVVDGLALATCSDPEA